MNYRMKIQYDGTRYKGWQRQGGVSGSDATIQGKMEAVLSRYVGKEIQIDGAGRTDAGVHAMEQIANVHVPENVSGTPEELKEYINEYLPEDIRVTAVERAGERFHSRLNAIGKRYEYHIMKATSENVFQRKYAWKVLGILNTEQMRIAADFLVGKHDFRSFCSKASKKKSTVRTIRSITFKETEQDLVICFEGDGFLYNMVRILVGTLVEVGLGKRQPEEMLEILERKERKYAGETAPAQGLFLAKVYYD
nr:tRNA pseudouridine(38-40) synthase TruA [Eubacterium sp.]